MNIPTQQAVGRNSHDPRIDAFNRQLRAQPWYQDWFRQQGLDPNHVHLSQGQRHQLEQLILQRANVPADAFQDMMIDPAGNLNTEHGFASQPTWLKALEIGGAAAAGGYAAAPIFGGGSAAASAAPALGAGEASTTLAATGGMVPGLSAGAGAGAGTAAGATAAGAGAGVAGGLGRTITDVAGKTAQGVDWVKLLAGLAGLVPVAMANKETASERALKEQQQRILGIQESRMNQQQPLFESTQRGLMAMLPTFMRNGGS